MYRYSTGTYRYVPVPTLARTDTLPSLVVCMVYGIWYMVYTSHRSMVYAKRIAVSLRLLASVRSFAYSVLTTGSPGQFENADVSRSEQLSV